MPTMGKAYDERGKLIGEACSIYAPVFDASMQQELVQVIAPTKGEL